MASYHFPIIVGKDKSERVVIIHLGDEEESKFYEENRVVITSADSSQTPLFRIHKKVNVISGLGGRDNSFYFKDKPKTKTDEAGEKMTPKKIIVTDEDNVTLKMKECEEYYDYYINVSDFDGDIFFKVKSGKSQYSLLGSLHIVRPGEHDNVLHINVDLGSDATQLNYFNESSGAKISNVNIIDCFQKAYEKQGRKYADLKSPHNGEPMFIQQDKDNSDFFKTGNITFKNKGDLQEPIASESNNSFINYLNVSAAGKNESGNDKKKDETWAYEIQYKNKLINIKLMYAYCDAIKNDVPNLEFNFKGDTKRVTNQEDLIDVLFKIYQEIIQTSIAGKKLNKKTKYFSVLLLVPNIYNQQNIDGLLYELNKMNKHSRIKYDFRVISESDSAFVGIKEIRSNGAQKTILNTVLQDIKKPKLKDMFLIIDAGKGTTDYSIIRYLTGEKRQANNEMVSVERGGIVGAGGAIDYVFTRVFARQIYNHINEINATIRKNNVLSGNLEGNIEIRRKINDIDEFIDRFMIMIEKLSPLDQDRMMHLVEVLKKEYKAKSGKTAQIYNCFASNEAKGIIDVLCDDNFDDNKYNGLIAQPDGWKAVSIWNWDTKSYVEVDEKDKEEISWVCDRIAEAIVDKMIFAPNKDVKITNQIDYVIFNGRSFMFEPLKDAFEHHIANHRGVWYENHGFISFFLKNNDKNKNLKVADLRGYNMKSVSVRFTDHDLGVNCNSNLCCVNGLDYIQNTFNQQLLYDGFDEKVNDNAAQKHYYIGYIGEKSFAPKLTQIPGENPADNDLISMTLFPVKYKPIDFDKKSVKKSTEAPSDNVSKTERHSTIDVTDSAIAHLNPLDVNQNL